MPTDLEIIHQLSEQIGTELVEVRHYLRRPSTLPHTVQSMIQRWGVGPHTRGYCTDPEGNVIALFLNNAGLTGYPLIISQLTNLNLLMVVDGL